MKLASLKIITSSLEKIENELNPNGVEDSGLRSRYAEYFTALKISELGFDVQLLEEREYRSADLYIPDLDKLIEVKSGYNCASFGKGTQISKEKFDYCVFYPVINGWIDEAYILSIDELKELLPRPELAEHPTNVYLLFFYDDYETYKNEVNLNDRIKIEKSLHKNPDEYRNNWEKILQ